MIGRGGITEGFDVPIRKPSWILLHQNKRYSTSLISECSALSFRTGKSSELPTNPNKGEVSFLSCKKGSSCRLLGHVFMVTNYPGLSLPFPPPCVLRLLPVWKWLLGIHPSRRDLGREEEDEEESAVPPGWVSLLLGNLPLAPHPRSCKESFGGKERKSVCETDNKCLLTLTF